MRRCDVLVVGGGPAGSSCARRLGEQGLDVVLLDRAKFPRDKTCGGWITPGVVQLLGLDLAEYAKTRVLQPITGFRISCDGRPAVRVRFGAPVSYGIRRCEFDHYLLARSGAEVFENTRIEQIGREASYWVVNGCFQAPFLIGAAGHFCPVARMLGARLSKEEAVIAQEVEWPCRSNADPAEPQLLFFADRSGYAWCLQKENYTNAGLGRIGTGSLAPYRQTLGAWLRASNTLPAEPPALHGHAYLTSDKSRRKVADRGVLLIGDAAGLADPRSGEGIRPAIESALLAAECIVEAAGDPSRVGVYSERLRARYPTRTIEWPVPGFVARTLMSLPLFVREVVVKRWFLHEGDRQAAEFASRYGGTSPLARTAAVPGS